MDRLYVMQLVKSFQGGHISRRTFLKRATLALGSAAAASLVLAACGSEQATAPASPTSGPAADGSAPPEGLIVEEVMYPDGQGGELMGYMARPESGEPLPAVVVLQEWWGLNAHIRDMTRRIAGEGFVALAPDLYDGVVVDEPDEAQKLVMELDMVEAAREIGQAASFLLEQDYTAGSKAGVVGFCMGGGLVLQTSRVFAPDTIGAGVVFYGRPLTAEQAADVQAPILGLYGAEDAGIPVADVQAMHAVFAEQGLTNELHVYDGAGHAFMNDTRQSYNAEAAADAWPRMLAWFGTHL